MRLRLILFSLLIAAMLFVTMEMLVTRGFTNCLYAEAAKSGYDYGAKKPPIVRGMWVTSRATAFAPSGFWTGTTVLYGARHHTARRHHP